MFDNRQTKAEIIAAASLQNERLIEALCERERLTLENWQLKGALGYAVPGDIPQGPFKCGLCESRALAATENRKSTTHGGREAQ